MWQVGKDFLGEFREKGRVAKIMPIYNTFLDKCFLEIIDISYESLNISFEISILFIKHVTNEYFCVIIFFTMPVADHCIKNYLWQFF
jgi:hypothetical protein